MVSTTRRELLASAAALALIPDRLLSETSTSTLAHELERGAGRPAVDLAADETFWTAVRQAFEQTPGQANLVTVVRGITPRKVRESIAAESERLNAFRPRALPDPDWRERVRAKAAAFIGAGAEEVALLRNTTEGVTTVLLNWPLQRGDEILTSSTEHGPFYDTLAFRAARDGVVVRRFHLPAPAPSPEAIAEAVEAGMTQRTRLVMVGQMSLTGQILPVRAIAERVHARGARLLVDGVLALGQMPTDVKAMDCDFYAAGFHKLACGPRATAVFYVRPALVEALPSLFGSIEEDRERGLVPRWNSPSPRKFESFGAHPAAHFHALGEAVDFVSAIGMERIRARFFALTRRWAERARKVSSFRAPVAIHPDHCAGLLSWELAGRDSAELARDLDTRYKILSGLTERYAGFFGIPEDRPRPLLITNVGLFTTPAEVDRLAEAIEASGASA